MKLVLRAWEINKNNFIEPWFVPDDIYYGKTIGEAKHKAWIAIRNEDLRDYCDEPITFLSLKMKRSARHDTFMAEKGVVLSRQRISENEIIEKRDAEYAKLLAENPDAKAYIIKGSYYYDEGFCGYTEYRYKAGIYTLQEAINSVQRCSLGDAMRLQMIDPVEHNALINSKIEELKRKLV